MRKPRAIIFDDDIMILDLLRHILAEREYEVRTFSEPTICPIYEEPAKKCNTGHPCADIMITDLRMPRMNGLEMLEYQLERDCPLTIKNKALVTTVLDRKSEEKVEKLGCAFIGKPFDLPQLERWLEECEKRTDLSRPLA